MRVIINELFLVSIVMVICKYFHLLNVLPSLNHSHTTDKQPKSFETKVGLQNENIE